MIFILGASVVGHAGNERIAFVHIRVESGELVLERIKVVEGSLKTPRRLNLSDDRIYFEVLDKVGKKLFEGTIPDPSTRRYEYADEDGTLHSKTVEVESVFISIRIPYNPSAKTVKFYRIEEAGGGRAKLVKAPEAFGSVTLDIGEVGDEK
jgi:hypothetical protein